MAEQFFGRIPYELLDSKLFRFEVVLPSVHEKQCIPCGLVYPDNIQQCTNCLSANLNRVNKTVVVDIKSIVSLDYETVESELCDIPSQFAFYACVYAEAKYRSNLFERVVKTIRSTVHDEIIQASQKESVRLTQDSIKILVEKDSRVNRAEGEFALSSMIASKLYYMIEAIRMKADLGRTLTSLKRSELLGS